LVDGEAILRPVIEAPETRYAKTADSIHIAYQVAGNGPRDQVFVPSAARSPMTDKRTKFEIIHVSPTVSIL
jgi:hypothetical protein